VVCPTDLAVSCKAAHCTAQPTGPGARRRPRSNGCADVASKQDVACAALTAAPPSWAAAARQDATAHFVQESASCSCPCARVCQTFVGWRS
jgi:hypothetical protein